MASTATQVIQNALGKVGIFQPEDTIPAEDSAAALTRLNRLLHGMNARGAVFPATDLALGDTVPVADQNLDDLEWYLAKAMAGQWGKILEGQTLIDARQGEVRFIAAYTVVYPATTDAGLRNMPSTRRW